MSVEDQPSDSLAPANRSNFHTTSWSIVFRATERDSVTAAEALAHLCESYWYPLYAFVRRKGYSAAQAEDLTQSFFSHLLQQKTIERADRERGKFRTFLLSSLENHLKNKLRHDSAEKRGGKSKIFSLDFESAEQQYSLEPSHESTPEKIFERNWALALLNQVMGSLEQQYADSGKSELFELIKGSIVGHSRIDFQQIGEQLAIKPNAVKVAVHRLRERYGQQLRLQIAKTTESPEMVDEELQCLFQALSRS